MNAKCSLCLCYNWYPNFIGTSNLRTGLEVKRRTTIEMEDFDANEEKDDVSSYTTEERLFNLEENVYQLTRKMTRVLETKAKSKVIIRRPLGLNRLKNKVILISKKSPVWKLSTADHINKAQ